MTKQQSNKLNVYDAPCVKVVSFTVEQGFAGSNFNNAPIVESNNSIPSMEDVDQATNNGTLDGYFQ